MNGAVAQSVEQKTENLCVGGSIPSHTTKKSHEIVVAFFILQLIKIKTTTWNTIQ
jgi:hypothetical protein